MIEPGRASQIPHLDNLFNAPVIYFDAVPTIGLRGSVLHAVLAVHVDEPVTSTQASDHVVAVANLHFRCRPPPIRAMLDEMLLAGAKTPGTA
jgi:hypothetical protein